MSLRGRHLVPPGLLVVIMPKAVALTQIEELRGENEFLQEAKAVSDADLKQLLKIMGEKGEKNDARCEEMRKIT